MNTRRGRGRIPGGRVVLGIILALLALPALAQTGPVSSQSLFFDQAGIGHQKDYLQLTAGAIYTDNVNLSSDKSGDTLLMVGLVGNTEREGAPRLDYHVDSDISLIKYVKADYSTQPYGYFDADAMFKIVPGTFNWTARETFNQATINSFEPVTPDNLESINYITTGPQLVLKPTLRTTITLDGVVGDVDSSSKSATYVNIDSRRYGGDARIDRAMNSNLSVYLLGTWTRVRFSDTTENTDFTATVGQLGIKLGDARTTLDGSVGYTRAQLDSPSGGITIPIRIHTFTFAPYPLGLYPQAIPAATAAPSSSDQTPSGVTWQLNLSRLISPHQRFSLRAMRQVTDAANLFVLNLAQPVPSNLPQQIVTGEPYTHTEYGGTYRIEGTRTSFEVDGALFRDRYEATPQYNRDADTINALLGRKLNAQFSADLGVSYEHDDYQAGGSLRTTDILASLRWRLGPRVGLRFIYAHSMLSPNGYSENQFGVTASYALTKGALTEDPVLAPLKTTSPAMQPRY